MVTFESTVPILRIFDEAKAREFYLDFLGFTLEFEHRFGENFPIYMGIKRDGVMLHLSEHHGDASPGSTVFLRMQGIDELCDELNSKSYRYAKPGVQEMEWGTREMYVSDPFGNRIRFAEYVKQEA